MQSLSPEDCKWLTAVQTSFAGADEDGKFGRAALWIQKNQNNQPVAVGSSPSNPAPIKPYIKFRRILPRNADADLSWSVPELCQAYDWPAGAPGGGVIAIVELGGGWTPSDVETYFGGIGQPSPRIQDVSVDGTAGNNPGVDSDADGEVALDIQVAGAAYYAATGHAATIRMYWGSGQLTSLAAAVRKAAADGCDVCSISWGSDEAMWNPSDAKDLEAAVSEAVLAGMVVFAAAGDNDSSDGGPTPANVDLPAACPHVIGCGGTKKTRTDEVVWNDNPGETDGEGTGGGFSTLFSLPSWQIGVPNGPGRVVPDVAANADPVTGYNIIVQGQPTTVGGTSAVAPLYAGLFAAFGRKLGWVTPVLYTQQLCFTDIVSGDNGAYRARVGPDACTGLGSPIGVKLAAVFAKPKAKNLRWIPQLEADVARFRAAAP